jgi:hypothetical protein
VRGGTGKEALEWVAASAGIPFRETPFAPGARAEWIRERQAIERELPTARYWRRAMAALTDELLDYLKAKLGPQPAGTDPASLALDFFEIYRVEKLAARLRRIEDRGLVEEFRRWQARDPHLTAWLIDAGEVRSSVEKQMLEEYIRG